MGTENGLVAEDLFDLGIWLEIASGTGGRFRGRGRTKEREEGGERVGVLGHRLGEEPPLIVETNPEPEGTVEQARFDLALEQREQHRLQQRLLYGLGRASQLEEHRVLSQIGRLPSPAPRGAPGSEGNEKGGQPVEQRLAGLRIEAGAGMHPLVQIEDAGPFRDAARPDAMLRTQLVDGLVDDRPGTGGQIEQAHQEIHGHCQMVTKILQMAFQEVPAPGLGT